ncbi:hypothetical protein LCGC14_0542340 [marine sediment metagenome]|uniref:Uncharacterized protein n=1 Tax=marine sediment metagenome TaxID=412755 RepID=A0A0F9RX50_9ZZZZ
MNYPVESCCNLVAWLGCVVYVLVVWSIMVSLSDYLVQCLCSVCLCVRANTCNALLSLCFISGRVPVRCPCPCPYRWPCAVSRANMCHQGHGQGTGGRWAGGYYGTHGRNIAYVTGRRFFRRKTLRGLLSRKIVSARTNRGP